MVVVGAVVAELVFYLILIKCWAEFDFNAQHRINPATLHVFSRIYITDTWSGKQLRFWGQPELLLPNDQRRPKNDSTKPMTTTRPTM